MPAKLSSSATTRIRETIDEAVDAGRVPGLVYNAIDSSGEIAFSHAAGTIGVGVDQPMTQDSVFWLASLTKVLTTIACMQLVENGELDLDDPQTVTTLAPELAQTKVLQREHDGTFRLLENERPVTLRQLLSHTAGFGYAFDDLKLHDWSLPIGLDDFALDLEELTTYPLVNQPGEIWQYGVNIDWVGVMVERRTGMALGDYITNKILSPLEIRSITFEPDDRGRSKLVFMHRRGENGRLVHMEHINRRPLVGQPGTKAPRVFHMGGSGCFGCPQEFCKIIAVLLADGMYRPTHTRLLKAATVQEMFTDQIPDKLRHTNEVWTTAKPALARSSPLLPVSQNAPADGDDTEGWGLSFALSLRPSSTGRAAGSASWEGLPNLLWFADRRTGIGAVLGAQVLPFGDPQVMKLAARVETLLYNGLTPEYPERVNGHV